MRTVGGNNRNTQSFSATNTVVQGRRIMPVRLPRTDVRAAIPGPGRGSEDLPSARRRKVGGLTAAPSVWGRICGCAYC